MRVLFFNYEYPPLGGGAGNATAYLLQEYAKMPDLEVDLVTSSVDAEYHLENIGANIRIHRLSIGKNSRNLHFQSQKDLLVYAWKAFWFARKLIGNRGYDLAHSFFTVPCGFLSLVYYRWYKLPYIVSLRGADVPGYSERFGFIYNLLKPIVRLIWKNARAVVANSQGLKELALKTNSKQNVGVIFNGISTDDFRPAEILPVDKFIITLGATRLTERKGARYVIEAVARLAQKYPQVCLKIMGEGDDKENLEKLTRELDVAEKVIFLGRIPREKTAAYYQEASVFVLPSLNEGMSNAMLEALATGLPILVTDTGGAKELVRAGENGFIIKTKDSADIAEKLEKLINNPELVASMRAESRKIAEKMSWQKVAGEYVEIYRRMTKKLSS